MHWPKKVNPAFLGLMLMIFLNTFLPKVGFETRSLPFHLNIVDILFVFLLILSIRKFLRTDNFSRFFPLTMLFSWGVVSAAHGYFSSAPLGKIADEFLRQYFYIFTAPLVFLLVGNRKERNRTVLALLVGVFPLAVFGLLQSVLGMKFVLWGKNMLLKLGYPSRAIFFPEEGMINEGRITSTLLCYNALGVYLASSSIFFLAKGLLDKKSPFFWRFFCVLTFILCLVVVILTRSRGSWMGFLVALVLFGIIAFRKKFWIFPILFVFFLGSFFFYNREINARIKSFLALRQDGSAWGRVEALKASLPAIKRSLPLGYGLGMYGAQKIPLGDEVYAGLDNFYIRYVLSNGTVGLLIFSVTVIWLFKKVFIQIWSVNIEERWLLVGGISSLTVLLVSAAFDSMLMVTTYIAMLFWLYFGLTLGKIYEKG